MENVELIHDVLSTDLNRNTESEMLMFNESMKQDRIELQKKLFQSDIALYKVNDYIKKLELKVSDLTKKNKQLHKSLQHYRQKCQKMKNENIEGLNVINHCLSFR